jgi:hypothetical protein
MMMMIDENQPVDSVSARSVSGEKDLGFHNAGRWLIGKGYLS